MVYRLATQNEHSLTDRYILVFAHHYESSNQQVIVPHIDAEDDVILKWFKNLNHLNRSPCRYPHNPVFALEYKVPPVKKFINLPNMEFPSRRGPSFFSYPNSPNWRT